MKPTGWLLPIALLVFFAAGAQGELSDLKSPVHLNLKEAAGLSPETIGDRGQEAIEETPPRSYTSYPLDAGRTREWKEVGTWTADGIQYDLGVQPPVTFNMWWSAVDDSYNTRLQFRWNLYIDGVDAAYYEDTDEFECEQSDPCLWDGQTNNLNVSSASKDAIFEVTIQYWAFTDIKIYYDNFSLDSGVTLNTDAVYLGKARMSGQEVGFEFVEAWETQAEEALRGNYLTFMVEGMPQNNTLQKSTYPRIGKGAEYELNGTALEAIMVTWYIDDKYASVEESTFMFGYGKPESSYAPAIAVALTDLPRMGATSTSDDGGLLGLPGFPLLLAIPALAWTARRRR